MGTVASSGDLTARRSERRSYPWDTFKMSVLGSLFVRWVAAFASLLGILLAADQLFGGARIRALEEALRGAETAENGENQRQIIDALHRRVVGRMIAREAVPWRKVVFSWSLLGASYYSQVCGIVMRSRADLDIHTIVAFESSQVTMGWIAYWHIFRLTFERLRIERCYIRGISPIRAYTDLMAIMEGANRMEVGWSWALDIAGVGLFFGIGLARIGGSWPVVVGTIFILGSCAVFMAGWSWVQREMNSDQVEEPRNRDNSLRPTWVVPDGGSPRSE